MSGKSKRGSKPHLRRGDSPTLTRVGVEAVKSKDGELTQRATVEHYAGPLPPPTYLDAYERIHPGLADRIVAMAEKQAEHRRGIEAAVVKGNVEAQRRGIWCALIIALAVLALAAYMLSLGMGGLSLTTVLLELTVLVGVFIGTKSKQQRELARKREQEPEVPAPRAADSHKSAGSSKPIVDA